MYHSIISFHIEKNEWLCFKSSEDVMLSGVVTVCSSNNHKHDISVNSNLTNARITVTFSFSTKFAHYFHCVFFRSSFRWRVVITNNIIITGKIVERASKQGATSSLDATQHRYERQTESYTHDTTHSANCSDKLYPQAKRIHVSTYEECKSIRFTLGSLLNASVVPIDHIEHSFYVRRKRDKCIRSYFDLAGIEIELFEKWNQTGGMRTVAGVQRTYVAPCTTVSGLSTHFKPRSWAFTAATPTDIENRNFMHCFTVVHVNRRILTNDSSRVWQRAILYLINNEMNISQTIESTSSWN